MTTTTGPVSDRHPSYGLPYAPGEFLPDTASHLRKLSEAWRHIRRRHADGAPLHNVSGLERGLPRTEVEPELLDDEWAGALFSERVRELGLEHLGGTPDVHDIAVTNRLSAALFAAMQVLVRPGDTVIGVSATHSHPAVLRAVRDAGGRLVDTAGKEAFEQALGEHPDVPVVALTRLAVTYDALPEVDLRHIVDLAHARGALVVVDDAGGARVGPAVLGQPRRPGRAGAGPVVRAGRRMPSDAVSGGGPLPGELPSRTGAGADLVHPEGGRGAARAAGRPPRGRGRVHLQDPG
jgi:L-seryl-tRNA(Ser) seleniumtransferase